MAETEKTEISEIQETRPTATQIDRLIAEYAAAQGSSRMAALLAARSAEAADVIKIRLTAMVEKWGWRHTEKSRRLAGLANTATTTTGTLVQIDDAAVELLRLYLGKTETPRLAEEFFTSQVTYSLVASPDEKLKSLQCGVRLKTKITGLLKACFNIKTKTPSLKVELAEKPSA